jgi:hypothetical protein
MGIPNLIILIRKSVVGDSGYGAFDEDFELPTPFPQRDFSTPANFGFEKEGRYFQTPQEYLNYKKQQRGGDDHVQFDKEAKRVTEELSGSDTKNNRKITSLEELKLEIMRILDRIPS